MPLVHDDYQDGDTVRRGERRSGRSLARIRQFAWRSYGLRSLRRTCLGIRRASASDDYPYAQACRRCHRWSRRFEAIETLADYNEVARMKSGPLLGLPVS